MFSKRRMCSKNHTVNALINEQNKMHVISLLVFEPVRDVVLKVAPQHYG